MSQQTATIEERFTALVDEMLSYPGVTHSHSGRGFASESLKVGDKIFAMLLGGRFVVKLPSDKVDTLVAAAVGERLNMGGKRILKEWVRLEPESDADWRAFAGEALTFVGSKLSK